MADFSPTAANVLASKNATRSTVTAGASIAAGDVVTFDGATKTYVLADANVAAKSEFGGIALNSAASGQPVEIVTKDDSFTPGFTIAAGNIVIMSATPGKMAPADDAASGDFVTVLMVGIGGNKARLSPISAGAAIPA